MLAAGAREARRYAGLHLHVLRDCPPFWIGAEPLIV